jgi:hypothetical protein
MPKLTLSYQTEEEIPASLKAYKVADKNEVEVWVGEKVAEETNPSLAANMREALNEKKTLQSQYDLLLTNASKKETDLNTTINGLRSQLANGHKITEEEVALLPKVKEVLTKYGEGKVETVETKLKEYDTIKPEFEKAKTEKETDEIFKASGFKNREAFNRVIANPNDMAKVEKMFVKKVKVGETETEKAFANIKKGDGKTEEVELSSLLKGDWAFYADKLMQVDNSREWLEQDQSDNTLPPKAGDPLTGEEQKKAQSAQNMITRSVF